MDRLREFLADPAMVGVWQYLITLFGALVSHLFGFQKGFEGSVPALKRLLPQRTAAFYYRMDLLLVGFVGSIAGLILFHPQNALEAFSAGCGWVGAVNLAFAGPAAGQGGTHGA